MRWGDRFRARGLLVSSRLTGTRRYAQVIVVTKKRIESKEDSSATMTSEEILV